MSATYVKPGVKLSYVIKSARLVGSVVLCDGDYTLTLAPGAPMKEAKGHYTKILAKVGDTWRPHQLDYSYLPPPAPAQQN